LKSTSGINKHNVDAVALRFLDGLKRHGCRILTGLDGLHNLGAASLSPSCQLFNRCRSERIGCPNKHRTAVIHQELRKLANRCGLSNSVYANDQDYGVTLCTSQSDPRREKRYFNMLRSGSIDGLIYNAGDAPWDDALPMIAEHFPLVVVDELVPGLEGSPLVTGDHRQGGDPHRERAVLRVQPVVVEFPVGVAPGQVHDLIRRHPHAGRGARGHHPVEQQGETDEQAFGEAAVARRRGHGAAQREGPRLMR